MPTLVASYFLWPAAQIVNFLLVPLDLRVLYTNLVSIAWTAYISNMASGHGAPADANADADAAAPSPTPARAAPPRALGGAGRERGAPAVAGGARAQEPARARRSSGGGTTLVV
jgi:hypothetical protein